MSEFETDLHYLDDADVRTQRLSSVENDYTISDYLQGAAYELGERYMFISDPVWGYETIGNQPHDEVLLELARTPLFRRLQSIEQLTLGPEYATMPNSMYFSRWQHIWGSLVYVRKMIADDGEMDDRQKMVLQLRTLLSDVGHTAFSHLGDWMFQGLDGGENLHDQDLKDILRASGVEAILERHGFTTEETVFPDVDDWVECPSPELCVDRVDYRIREIARWVEPTIPFHLLKHELQQPQQLFEIDEGRLIIRSQQFARYYAAGFSLLPTEHWSHPVHRLQLQLLQSAVRASVIDKIEFNTVHPREALYGIDSDFYAHFQTWDMLHLQRTMRDIGLTQRQIFTQGRRSDLNRIFSGIGKPDWQFPEFPDPLRSYSWQSREFGEPYPPNIVIEEKNVEGMPDFKVEDKGLTVALPPLKARAIDPPVRTEGGDIKLLSELEPSYASYLAGQRAVMGKSYEATVLMRPDIAERIVRQHKSADEDWSAYLERPRSATTLQRIIESSEIYGALHRFDTIHESDDEAIIKRSRSLGRMGLAPEL